MKVLSVNVGKPIEVEHNGKTVRTAIFKQAVDGPVMLRTLNVDGDGQADLDNHGGKDKAAYLYPHQHYAYWQAETGRDDLMFGQFGENFTVESLAEDTVFIGDIYRLGQATIQVTSPRIPCFKLGIRMTEPKFPKWFAAAERSGFYVQVLEEGMVEAGDAIEQLASNPHQVSVRDIFHQVFHFDDVDIMQRAAQLEILPGWYKQKFREQIDKQQAD